METIARRHTDRRGRGAVGRLSRAVVHVAVVSLLAVWNTFKTFNVWPRLDTQHTHCRK